jgi:uncharacterized membrane protein
MAGRSWIRWGLVLGFALGGFFDGILLHQILQWHHLLSLADGSGDLRAQMLWDGYFHALMYLLAVAALLGLWRARGQLPQRPGQRLGALLLMGFGIWHIIDSVLSHWILGIHRIRIDSPDPLIWDLIWFAAFGLGPLAIGWLMFRGLGARPARPGSSTTAVALVGLLASGMAAWSMQPARQQSFTTLVFAPGIRPAGVMDALASADARLIWSDPTMEVVVVAAPDADAWHFYRRGALLVSGSGLPSGCFNWSRV